MQVIKQMLTRKVEGIKAHRESFFFHHGGDVNSVPSVLTVNINGLSMDELN